MTRGLRHAGLVVVLAASALDSLSARRPPPGDQTNTPYVAISSMLGRIPNIDPLVDPYPFFLVRPWIVSVPGTSTVAQRGGEDNLELPLDIQAMNFSGTIFLTATYAGSASSPFSFSVTPNQISVGSTAPAAPGAAGAAAARFRESVLSSGGGEASMRIPTASAVVTVSTTSPAVGAGSFLVAVEARQDSATGMVLGTGYFVVSLVVIPNDSSTRDCPNVVSATWKLNDEDPPGYQKPDVLGIQQFLRGLFITKRMSPEKTAFPSGVSAPSHRAGWDMVVDKPPASTSPAIDVNESLVRLVNPTRRVKSLVAVGANCRIIGNIVLNPGDPAGEIRITKASTRTLVLTDDGRALGRFTDSNFWTLFGGRRVTLTAIQ